MDLHKFQEELRFLVTLRSTRNAGDPSSIPGSERSLGEGAGYSLQYSRVSQVVQLVKTPPAMWETWFRSLGQEDPLEEGMAAHSSIPAWRIPGQRSLKDCSPCGHRVGHD